MFFDRMLFRDLRKMAGFTQEELAQELGVTKQALQQWERGKTVPRPGSFRRICEILNWPGFATPPPAAEPPRREDLRVIIRAVIAADLPADQKLEIIRKVVE